VNLLYTPLAIITNILLIVLRATSFSLITLYWWAYFVTAAGIITLWCDPRLATKIGETGKFTGDFFLVDSGVSTLALGD